MRTVAFVGPSIDAAEVSEHFHGEVRPPIKRGDLDGLVRSRSEGEALAAGIIDGQFLQSLAVTPKEVIRAIDAGVTVVGGASMGALRAAECAPFGMVGVGRIYAMYAAGEVDGDDEVAITFDAATSRPLVEPLVNLRVATAAACARGLIDELDALRIVDSVRQLYFPQRTTAATRAVVRRRLPSEQARKVIAFLDEEAPDQKRLDAVGVLERLDDLAGHPRGT